MYSSVLGWRWTQRSRVRVLALAKNFFEQFFSALCDSFNFFRHCATLSIFFGTATFFSIFFVAKGSPLQVFWYFAANWSFKKPKGSPYLVFRQYETVSKVSFFVFFSKIFPKKFLYFLNVSKGSPSTFLIFCNRLDFQKVERVPLLTNFKKLRFFEL